MERRISSRFAKDLPVCLDFAPELNLNIKSITRDISHKGFFTFLDLSEVELPPKVRVSLSLSDNCLFESSAEIVRIIQQSGRITGLGVRFDYRDSNQQELISTYIQNNFSAQNISSRGKTLESRLGQRLSDREKINFEILNTFRIKGPISKTQIAQIINLNMGTLTNYINSFIKDDIVKIKGFDVSTGGRPPELLEINANYAFIIGIEISDKFIKGIAINFAGLVVVKKEIFIDESVNNALDASLIESLILDLANNLNIDYSKIIALGLGGVVSFDDIALVKKTLEERFKVPIIFENSFNASLFAECWLSGVKDKKRNIMYLADFNHISMLQGENLLLDNGRIGTKDSLSNEVMNNDSVNVVVKDIIEESEKNLACIVNVLSPDVIVIASSFIKLQENILEKVKSIINKWCFDDIAKNIEIISSQLGNDSVSFGMASLALRDMFIQIQ
ncbi:MAG: ROK family protein [Candidatus Gygaella obscura]|nr:ROK family protein [Candidatus Gygaella obscura]